MNVQILLGNDYLCKNIAGANTKNTHFALFKTAISDWCGKFSRL